MLKMITQTITIAIMSILGLIFPASTTDIKFVVTPKTQSNINIPIISTPTETQEKTVVKPTTTPTKKIKPAVIKEVPATIPIITSTTTEEKNTLTFDQINEKVRSALVNIICIPETPVPTAITGSGVIISKTGLIITNAHIGQYWLIKNLNGKKNSVDCTIRTGSPAHATYNAELIYISPQWIEENKTILIDQNPKGTGEHDYAFLQIKSPIDGLALPNEFPFITARVSEDPYIGENVLLASYPAGFLGGISIVQYLYQSSAITKVSDVFTFKADTIDVISVGGTIVSQKGSSGGAVVDEHNQLIGIITTSTSGDTTSARDLKAITLTYINRDLKNEAKVSIKTLGEQALVFGPIFNQTIAPTLTKILEDVLLNKK
jgi:hypothetical protein